jgi:hypothetical protein
VTQELGRRASPTGPMAPDQWMNGVSPAYQRFLDVI